MDRQSPQISPVYLPGKQYGFLMLDSTMQDGSGNQIKKNSLLIASLVAPFVKLFTDTNYVIVNSEGVFIRHVVLDNSDYIAYTLNSPKIDFFRFRRNKNVKILRVNKVLKLKGQSAAIGLLKSNPLLID